VNLLSHALCVSLEHAASDSTVKPLWPQRTLVGATFKLRIPCIVPRCFSNLFAFRASASPEWRKNGNRHQSPFHPHRQFYSKDALIMHKGR
jgi:hypothetical protein